MEDYVKVRVLASAEIMINKGSTVREIAKELSVSKSTVHKDLTERLFFIDEIKYQQVKLVLEYHKKIRHIRGGLATKRKYKNTILT